MVSRYWFSRTQIAPDLHFNYEVTSIKVRSDASAVLYGTFRVRGTKIMDRATLAMTPFLLVQPHEPGLKPNRGVAYYYEDKQEIAHIGASEDGKVRSTFCR